MKRFLRLLAVALICVCCITAIAGCTSKSENIVNKYEIGEYSVRFTFKKGTKEQHYDIKIVYKSDFAKYQCETLDELLCNNEFTGLDFIWYYQPDSYVYNFDDFFTYEKNQVVNGTDPFGFVILTMLI